MPKKSSQLQLRLMRQITAGIASLLIAASARMERALHPELAKRIVQTNPANQRSNLGQQSALTLINGTKNGGGKSIPEAQQSKDVRILDIFQNAASVRINAATWVDYLQVAEWNGRWVIVNVLWEIKAS